MSDTVPVDVAARPLPEAGRPWVPTEVTSAPLGTLVGARSGDKAGNANLGLFVRDQSHYSWLESFLTSQQLVELAPDLAEFELVRHLLPNLGAINFEIIGLLDDGVSSSLRADPQAKGLAEYIRSIEVPIPTRFLARDA